MTAPAGAAATPDPIFAAIEAHRLAFVAMNAAPDDDLAIVDTCIALEQTMCATIPTTLAGLRALVEYANCKFRDDDMFAIEYFPAILKACRSLLPDRAEVPAPVQPEVSQPRRRRRAGRAARPGPG